MLMIIPSQADDVDVALGKMTDTQSQSIMPEYFSGPLGVPSDVPVSGSLHDFAGS
jgi:hypothetical protein